MKAPVKLNELKDDATLVDVAETIAKNYSIHHQTAEQLKTLQEWVTKIREVSIDVTGRTKGN